MLNPLGKTTAPQNSLDSILHSDYLQIPTSPTSLKVWTSKQVKKIEEKYMLANFINSSIYII